MIDALYITAEDAIRTKDSAALITEGQPVSLNAAGELIAATSVTKAYGVSKLDSNAYQDFAFGEVGAFGTGKLTVVTKGVVRIKDTVYNEIEINTQMGPTSTATTVVLLDAGVTFAVNDYVYVAASTGYITNVAAGGSSKFGKVVAIPSQTGGWLEVEVETSLAGADGSTGSTGPTGPTGA